MGRASIPAHPLHVAGVWTGREWTFGCACGRTGEVLGSFPSPSRAFRAPRAPEIPISFDPFGRLPRRLSIFDYNEVRIRASRTRRLFSTLDKHAWKKYWTVLPLTFLCLGKLPWRSHWRGILPFFPILCLFICLFVLNHSREWNSIQYIY